MYCLLISAIFDYIEEHSSLFSTVKRNHKIVDSEGVEHAPYHRARGDHSGVYVTLGKSVEGNRSALRYP